MAACRIRPSLPTEPNCSSRCGVGGYNLGPADLVVVPLDGSEPWELIADGWDNVSLPGSAWSEAADAIVYSSTEDPHDEIWMIDVAGDHTTRRITLHDDEVAYEPSWSPDGTEVVYELHPFDVEGEGRVARAPASGSDVENVAAEVFLTPAGEDCRQPNWAAEGDLVVFQCTDDGESSADVWAVEVDGTGLEQITTDSGYEGAPSWSPDGTQIAFEASAGDPDGDRTVVRFIDVGGVFTAP